MKLLLKICILLALVNNIFAKEGGNGGLSYLCKQNGKITSAVFKDFWLASRMGNVQEGLIKIEDSLKVIKPLESINRKFYYLVKRELNWVLKNYKIENVRINDLKTSPNEEILPDCEIGDPIQEYAAIYIDEQENRKRELIFRKKIWDAYRFNKDFRPEYSYISQIVHEAIFKVFRILFNEKDSSRTEQVTASLLLENIPKDYIMSLIEEKDPLDPPSVISINRGSSALSNPTNSSGLIYFDVTFNKPITNITTYDFVLSNTGTGVPFIVSILGQGAFRTVIVDTLGSEGNIGLNLVDSDSSIVDIAGNNLIPNFHESDQYWTVDLSSPQLISINRENNQLVELQRVKKLEYNVLFSEKIKGLEVKDFLVTTISGTATAVVKSLTDLGGSWKVTLEDLRGEGEVRLDLVDYNCSVTDMTGVNCLSPKSYITGETYSFLPSKQIDLHIIDIRRGLLPKKNPTIGRVVAWNVTFSRDILGGSVTPDDFKFHIIRGSFERMKLTGISVIGPTITIQTEILGKGEVRLDLNDWDLSITDIYGEASKSTSHVGDETWIFTDL